MSEVICESERTFCNLNSVTNRMKRTPKKKVALQTEPIQFECNCWFQLRHLLGSED